MAERVLVLGGGLAGVACARRLGDAGIEVTLVDRNDYHQFQPLLYQVASSQLPAQDIARPHQTIFREHDTVRVVNAHVVQADLSSRSLTLDDGTTLQGSHLVMAAGARPTSSTSWRGTSMPFRCTRWRTPNAFASICSTCSRRPWPTGPWRSRVSSTWSWSGAARPASRPPVPWPSSCWRCTRQDVLPCRARSPWSTAGTRSSLSSRARPTAMRPASCSRRVPP